VCGEPDPTSLTRENAQVLTPWPASRAPVAKWISELAIVLILPRDPVGCQEPVPRENRSDDGRSSLKATSYTLYNPCPRPGGLRLASGGVHGMDVEACRSYTQPKSVIVNTADEPFDRYASDAVVRYS
jgi:hypothetical protein